MPGTGLLVVSLGCRKKGSLNSSARIGPNFRPSILLSPLRQFCCRHCVNSAVVVASFLVSPDNAQVHAAPQRNCDCTGRLLPLSREAATRSSADTQFESRQMVHINRGMLSSLKSATPIFERRYVNDCGNNYKVVPSRA